MMSATDAGDHGADPVGSLADEFTKLLGALSGCLADHRTESAESDADGVAGEAPSAECRFCPLCRTVHVVREVSPEVKEHLRSAGVSLLHAASGLLSALTVEPPAEDKPRPRSTSGIEHIDLDDGPSTDPTPEER